MNQTSFYSVSEPTHQITWALPAEPYYRVTRGGLRPARTPYLHAAVGIGLVGAFVLLTIFLPHGLRAAGQPSAPAALPPLPTPAFAHTQAAPPPPLTHVIDLVHPQGFRVAPSAPTAGRSFIYHYVN